VTLRLLLQGERKYTEVYRDPEDADIESSFQMRYFLKNLQPGCSYAFRIRAINGFGPGPFAYKVCTTRPAKTAIPKAITVAHDSVTLRWLFSNTFMYQMQQLQKLFKLADADGSGQVSREELIAIFHDKESTHGDLMVMIRKVLKRKGISAEKVSLYINK
jgi:hypothetical protein